MKRAFKILVPIDFSPLSIDALFAAVDIARQYGGRVLAMHVIDFVAGGPFFLDGSSSAGDRDGLIDIRINKEKEMEGVLDDERARGISIRPIFAIGIPDKEIVERAKRNKVDLIIMSTHGRAGIGHFLLGSVTEKVLRKAECPVLTLNPHFLADYKSGTRAFDASAGSAGKQEKESLNGN